MIFKRVLKLPSVKKQISSAHGAGTIVQLQTDLKLQLKRVLKCFFIFTFNNALFQFLFLSMIKIHQYCLHIPYSFKLLMPLFLSVYAELLEHLNDTLLLFHGQLWNPLFCWCGFSTTTVQSHSVFGWACMFATSCCFPLSHQGMDPLLDAQIFISFLFASQTQTVA